MADLLYTMSWAAQNHFMPRFALVYTQGVCQRRHERRKGKAREYFFPHKNNALRRYKKLFAS